MTGKPYDAFSIPLRLNNRYSIQLRLKDFAGHKKFTLGLWTIPIIQKLSHILPPLFKMKSCVPFKFHSRAHISILSQTNPKLLFKYAVHAARKLCCFFLSTLSTKDNILEWGEIDHYGMESITRIFLQLFKHIEV